MADTADLRAVGDRIGQLLDEVRSSADARVWLRVEELVRLLTELYGAGLARTVELGDDDDGLLRRMADDELVGNLLLIHGLHPDGLGVRVQRTVDAVAPTVRAKGGDVEILSVDEASGVGRVMVT